MRVLMFVKIIIKSCNPADVDLSLTWAEAWRVAGQMVERGIR